VPLVHTEIPLIELYNSPVSTCSQKVRMALWEKEISWQDRLIVFQKNDHLSDWYLAINLNGVVPALVHDGKTIINSSVINEYLEDVFPDRPLRPRDPVEVAHMRAWRQFIDEVPTVAIRYPSFDAAFVHIWTDMSAAGLQINKALRRFLSPIFLSDCRKIFACRILPSNVQKVTMKRLTFAKGCR